MPAWSFSLGSFYKILQTLVLSRYRKLEIPIASEKQIVFIDNSKTQWRWDELAVQVQTPKHSGGADIIGSAGAVNPAVQRLQLGQRTVQSAPFREILNTTGENSLRTWKTDTESKNHKSKNDLTTHTETPARYRQCRRATPVPFWYRQVLGNADKHNERVHPHRRTQNEHTDPWTVTVPLPLRTPPGVPRWTYLTIVIIDKRVIQYVSSRHPTPLLRTVTLPVHQVLESASPPPRVQNTLDRINRFPIYESRRWRNRGCGLMGMKNRF